MRKNVLMVLALIVLAAGCGGKADYSDFADVNARYIHAMDVYTSGLEQAADANAVAAAIDQFAATMEALAPEMKKLKGKYPELQDRSKIPEELRALNEKAEEVVERLPHAMSKPMQYMGEPAVTAALQRLQGVMVKMQ